jgi:hypothetical protein
MNVRTKATILTIFFIIVFSALQFVDFSKITSIDPNILSALIVSTVIYLGLYWTLGFEIKGFRFVTILGAAAFIVFIQSLFLDLIVLQDVVRISEKTFSIVVIAVFGLSVHFLILTSNILNKSYISQIPLAQAAKAAYFIYTLFAGYFAMLLILKSGISLYLQPILFISMIFFLTINIFWHKKESFRQLIGETSAVVLFMLTVYMVLLPWPLAVEVASMFYVVIYYVLLGLGLEVRETTSFVMRVEYAVLFLVAVILLLNIAVWGINGTFL